MMSSLSGSFKEKQNPASIFWGRVFVYIMCILVTTYAVIRNRFYNVENRDKVGFQR